MSATTLNLEMHRIPSLMGGDPCVLKNWVARWETGRALVYLTVIFLGAGLYGVAMGFWRSPVQAGYNMIKFPLVILATALGNSLINGMFAPLFGLNLRFRQSLMLVLMSFTIAAVVMGSFAPLAFFIIWNTPSLSTVAEIPWVTYSFVQLAQVAIIAIAGVLSNVRLFRLLHSMSGSERVARKILFSWLAGNLFLGSQLCWILRPLIGSPGLPVEFLRTNAFQGNFYETVFRALSHLFSS